MSEHVESVPRCPLAWPAGWVRTTHRSRMRAPFTSKGRVITIFDATQRLEAEVTRLGGKNPTLSTNVSLRLDGRPRSDEQPADPGAALYFTFKGRATVFACDRWNTVGGNIGAIAAHIDALRRVQRYGVGSIEQAIAGYKALPADTAADWRAVMNFLPGAMPDRAKFDAAYRALQRERHPDAGGTDIGFTQLQRAKEFAFAELGFSA